MTRIFHVVAIGLANSVTLSPFINYSDCLSSNICKQYKGVGTALAGPVLAGPL